MTPQEKAIELIDKYFKEVLHYEVEYGYVLAKQCALIAVEEILSNDCTMPGVSADDDFSMIIETEHWQQVKQEIEKK